MPKPAAPALDKYAEAGVLLTGKDLRDRRENCRHLLETLESWTEAFSIPKLSDLGMERGHVEAVVAEAGNKNAPVELTSEDIASVVSSRL